nr:MAG TPA: 3' exoribonuclease [Caudoviricetes sp.]
METLSTEHNAALLSIGAVIHDFSTGQQVDTFYANITPESSIAAGLDVSESTKAWWAKQGQAAQDVLSVDQRPLRDVLVDFTKWLAGHGVQYAIGNGPRADNQWLESACKSVGMQSPIKYWGDLDMRTLTFIGTHILGLDHWHNTFKGVKHNALHDAINEAEFCNAVFQKLINRKPKEMAEFTLSIKTESTSELADIVAKLNGGNSALIASDPKLDGTELSAAANLAESDPKLRAANTPLPAPVQDTPVPQPEPQDDEPTNATPPATDKNGLPWDERIHAGTKALNGDGTWKKRRGVDDATVAAVTAELTGATPAPTPAPQPEPEPTPAPTPAQQPESAPTPAPVPSTNRIQDFQQIVQELQKAGTAAAADYMPKYHGQIVQTLLKLSGVTTVPEATTEQMQKMYEVRDQIISNLPSIVAGVPIADLVK